MSRYAENEHKEWTIGSECVKWVDLEPTRFDTEAGYDFVRIRGADERFQEFSGNMADIPKRLRFAAPATIEFRSDGSGSAEGFWFNWMCVTE